MPGNDVNSSKSVISSYVRGLGWSPFGLLVVMAMPSMCSSNLPGEHLDRALRTRGGCSPLCGSRHPPSPPRFREQLLSLRLPGRCKWPGAFCCELRLRFQCGRGLLWRWGVLRPVHRERSAMEPVALVLLLVRNARGVEMETYT